MQSLIPGSHHHSDRLGGGGILRTLSLGLTYLSGRYTVFVRAYQLINMTKVLIFTGLFSVVTPYSPRPLQPIDRCPLTFTVPYTPSLPLIAVHSYMPHP